ncbi:MAG: hypothetical protein IPL39_02260 [Opitutaceae bacterium]|nr:hypothetical protein [Opitutaceae bacterium]
MEFQPQPDWARGYAIGASPHNGLTVAQICALPTYRQTVFTYRNFITAAAAVLRAAWGGTPAVVRGAVREELLQQLLSRASSGEPRMR